MAIGSLSRRRFLAGSAGLALLPTVPASAKAPSLNFVVIGDWGREGASQQREVGRQMGVTAEAIGSRFTVSVGDNFYENGVTGLNDVQWRQSFEEIYPAASLQSPWHAILGNHDYIGDVQAQIDYSKTSARWRMPARYFQRSETIADGTRVDFFFLDTSPFVTGYYKPSSRLKVAGQDIDAQVAWLDRSLGASTAPWKIVIGHHPIYTVKGGKRDTPELIARIKPLLQAHGVRMYINGHDHNMQHLVVDDIHFITSGAGSKTSKVPVAGPGQFTSDHHGFMTVELSARDFGFGFVDDKGAALYQAAIPLTV